MIKVIGAKGGIITGNIIFHTDNCGMPRLEDCEHIDVVGNVIQYIYRKPQGWRPRLRMRLLRLLMRDWIKTIESGKNIRVR